MKTIDRRRLLLASALGLTLPAARAQAYPNRAIKLVVPYPAGSTLDVAARGMADAFGKRFGQPPIVLNQPGGSGAIGTRAVARSDPDGYTLLLGTNQTHGANSALNPTGLGYDALADFTPIAMVGRLQHVLVVRNGLGVKTLDQFIALGRRPDQKLNYGSSGIGSASHLAAEMFKGSAGVAMSHVPFSGSSQVAQALIGGHVDATFSTLPSVLGALKAGTVTPLAVASKNRAPQLPELRTLAEQGVRNAEADAWVAFFAPARTPAAAVDLLTRFTVDEFSTREMQQKLETAGYAPEVLGGAAFQAFLAQDMKRWADVVRSANVKLE
jgi:tripartite-type tricarboxylate transporter receptor subunit TctC